MSKATILIVEDDAILAMYLQEIITNMGYTIAKPLASGEEALAFLADNPVDLVLMDIELAGRLNGIETAESISRTSDVPIIFLTGYSHDPLLEQAKIAAPYGYLIKPVPERELAASLSMALHRHALDKQLKESRIALARSEARYRNLFESSPLGIFRTTLDGSPLAVNAEMARIVGCATPEEAIADFRDLAKNLYVNPERRQEFIHQLQDKSFVQHFVFEGRKKNGETIWISMNARLTTADEDGGEPHDPLIDGFAIDITENKRAEQALRESEEKHRRLFENMNQGVVYHDTNDAILDANPAAQRILGLTLDQMQGKTSLDPRWKAIREDGSDLPGEEHPSMVASRTGKPVTRFIMRVMMPETASSVWISVSAVPIFKPGETQPYQVYATFDNISEQRQAEQNYQTLFHEMLDGFALHEIICGADGKPKDYRFLAVNPAFERMTGLKAADIIGSTVLEILPGIEKHWIETYGRVALEGEPMHFESFSADLGKYFEITAFQPAPGQFACIFVDITDRKKAEAEHKQLQAQLQQAQKMEAIGTLAGGIAHDFNNILGAILGYAEMALDDCPVGSMAANDVGQVVKAGHRARELVKQILAFSRQAETEHMPLQPASIIKEAIKMLRSSLPSTITIKQDVNKDAGPLFADPTQIHQILMNLCTNAFHAMEETGGTLSISLQEKTLSRQDLTNEPQAEPGNFVCLSVGDTGAGISPEIQERIFDPYFTTKETGKGTGMGLSIVHGIVKSYGGFISCHSTPGEGTTFQVFLPVMTEIILPAEIMEEPLQFGNERILFVDDEEMLVEMGRNLLERLGYRVTVRTSSLDALTTFQNQPDQFDLVITDQTMPGMTGSDLARRMLQIRPDLPIILCTGFSNLISAERARSLGIKGFALKPLAKKDIAALIRKALDNGRLVDGKS